MEYNGVKPKKGSRMEAKKWNYYNSDKWDFIPIRYWPRSIASAVITGRLDYTSTFEWFLYLMGNGMDPEAAKTVIGKEVGFKRDVMDRLTNIKRDLFEKRKEWKYWDETTRRYENVHIVGGNNAKKGKSIRTKRQGPNANRRFEMRKRGYEWDDDYGEWVYSHVPWEEEEMDEEEMDEEVNPFSTIDEPWGDFSDNEGVYPSVSRGFDNVGAVSRQHDRLKALRKGEDEADQESTDEDEDEKYLTELYFDDYDGNEWERRYYDDYDDDIGNGYEWEHRYLHINDEYDQSDISDIDEEAEEDDENELPRWEWGGMNWNQVLEHMNRGEFDEEVLRRMLLKDRAKNMFGFVPRNE